MGREFRFMFEDMDRKAKMTEVDGGSRTTRGRKSGSDSSVGTSKI